MSACKPDSKQCWLGEKEPTDIYDCCEKYESCGIYSDDDNDLFSHEDDDESCVCEHHFDKSLWPLYLVLMILCIIGFPWAIPPLTTACEVGTIIIEGIIFSSVGKCG